MQFLLLFVLSLNFGSIFAASPQYAWWMNSNIDTACSSGQSGTVTYKGTCYVLLSKEIVSRLPGYEHEDIADTGAEFHLEFPEEPDSSKYYATSVYKDRDGKTGRALIVSLDSDLKQIVRIETREGVPGFSALFIEGSKLIWSFCLYCGDYVPVANKGR